MVSSPKSFQLLPLVPDIPGNIAEIVEGYIKNKVYKSWVQFYSSDESYKQVAETQQILNVLNEENQQCHQKMINHFIDACKYEFHFWEMAFNMDGKQVNNSLANHCI